MSIAKNHYRVFSKCGGCHYLAVPGGNPIFVPTVEHRIVYPRASVLEWRQCTECLQRVNESAIVLKDVEYPPEYVLFLGINWGRRLHRQSFGLILNVSCRDPRNAFGWNHFLDLKGEWRRLLDWMGNEPFKTADLSWILECE